jgi:hypothetical protein
VRDAVGCPGVASPLGETDQLSQPTFMIGRVKAFGRWHALFRGLSLAAPPVSLPHPPTKSLASMEQAGGG